MKLTHWRILLFVVFFSSFATVLIVPMIQTLAGLIVSTLAWFLLEISIVQRIEIGTQQQVVKMIQSDSPKIKGKDKGVDGGSKDRI